MQSIISRSVLIEFAVRTNGLGRPQPIKPIETIRFTAVRNVIPYFIRVGF